MKKNQIKIFCVIFFFLGAIFLFRSSQHKVKPQAYIYPSFPFKTKKVSQALQKIVAIDPQYKEEMENYFLSFPYQEYQIYDLPRLGAFYLDDLNNTVKTFLSRGHIWEKHIYNNIKKYAKKGSTVIDVGAYIGTFTFCMGKCVGPSGKVIAFEPQPKIFRELFMNTLLNKLQNIRLFWAGVADKPSVMELSPLLKGNEAGTGLNGGTGQHVEITTIDSLSLDHVSLIKIDVEGMEEKVLDGAKNTLTRCKPVILIEILGGMDFDTCSDEQREQILQIKEKIRCLGYEVMKLQGHDYIAMPNESA